MNQEIQTLRDNLQKPQNFVNDRPNCCDGQHSFTPEHFVQFYETDEFLVASICEHIGSGLGNGEGAIIIATPEHRAAVEDQLAANGLNLSCLKERGQYVALDAAETLARFMVGSCPDETLFKEVVGRLVGRVARQRRGIRAFGEMVALLWADGNHTGAIRLEELWNNLAKQYLFSLFCAYPLTSFDGSANSVPMLHVCDTHTRVLPGESFSEEVADNRNRQVAMLQQKARSLELEIEERKRCEAALVRREHELSDLLENAAEGIHQVAGDGTILWANRTELELLGYSPEEYIGHHIAEFYAEKTVIDEVLARLKRGEELQDFEAKLKHKDGSIRYVAINTNVCWEGDKFIYTRCFTRDISDRKRNAETLEKLVAERTLELRETNAHLEAFSYSVSHDLRAPLRTMQSYARLLLEDYASALVPEASDYLQRIDKAASRLDQLIRDVLAFSKVSNGQIELKPVALEGLVDTLVHQFPGFGQGFVQVQRPLHAVLGHEAYLTQCLTNLVDNALKFVPAGTTPRVCIQSELVDGRVKVSVKDNGIGIHPEHFPKLFQIFGRVHPDKRFPGTGIGLAIVQKAVTRMNGKVGFDSEPGQGSTFWFTLPRAVYVD